MGVRTWLRRWTGRQSPGGTSRRHRPPVLVCLEDRSVPAVVGYYDMSLGQGAAAQVAPITTAGQTAVLLSDLTTANLTGIDVLFVQNPNNSAYGSEYLSRLQAIQDAVSAGMTLILHDRYVDNAEAILPGGAGFSVLRSLSLNIDVLDDSTALTHGPGGTVTNTTLDSTGNLYSDHGYAVLSSLPAGARALLSDGNPAHVVTFSYRFGAGNVVYSSIPLDYYLANPNDRPAFNRTYAPNVVAYGAALLNGEPVAAAGTLSLNEDTSAGGRLSATDPDGDPLTFRIVSGPQHGTLDLTDASTGDYVYTPAPNYHGADSFTFSVSDDRGGTTTATVGISVAAVNDAPVAADDELTTAEDTAGTVAVRANDTDVDGDTLVVDSVTQGAYGTVEVNANGTLTYTPAADFNGTDTFTYTVRDGHGGAASATVRVTVTPVNDPPVVHDVTAITDEDNNVTLDVLAAATDVDGDELSVVGVTQGEHGAVAINPDGTVTYSPEADFHGTDTFTVTISDGQGATTAAVVAVTVESVNDLPTAVAGAAVTGDEGASVAFNVAVGDVDGDALVVTWDFGDGGTATGPAVTHTYADDGVYTVTMTVDDGAGGVVTAALTATISDVAPAVALGPDAAIDEGDTFTGVGSFADPGADTWTGTVDFGDGSGVQPLALNPDGSFALGHQYTTPGTYTVTVQVTDDEGQTGTDTLTVTVADVPPQADAGPDRTVTEGSVVVLTGSVTAAGTETYQTSWVVLNSAAQVVASGDGATVSFVSPDDGVYTATFTVRDDEGNVSTDSVVVTVVNDPPTVAVIGPTQSRPGDVVTYSGGFTDSGTADTHTLSWQVLDVQGTVVACGSGTTLTFKTSKPGTYTVVFTVTDDDGGVGTATVQLDVKPGSPWGGGVLVTTLLNGHGHGHAHGHGKK